MTAGRSASSVSRPLSIPVIDEPTNERGRPAESYCPDGRSQPLVIHACIGWRAVVCELSTEQSSSWAYSGWRSTTQQRAARRALAYSVYLDDACRHMVDLAGRAQQGGTSWLTERQYWSWQATLDEPYIYRVYGKQHSAKQATSSSRVPAVKKAGMSTSQAQPTETSWASCQDRGRWPPVTQIKDEPHMAKLHPRAVYARVRVAGNAGRGGDHPSLSIPNSDMTRARIGAQEGMHACARAQPFRPPGHRVQTNELSLHEYDDDEPYQARLPATRLRTASSKSQHYGLLEAVRPKGRTTWGSSVRRQYEEEERNQDQGVQALHFLFGDRREDK
nr:unnamed protein product [Digitaria exilis]